MRGRYTAADCRALFPASRKKIVVEKAAELRKELDRALDRHGDEGRMEAVLVVRRKLTEFTEEIFYTARASGKQVDKYVAGVRPDIAIGRQGDNGQELETWVDVVGTNLISHAYARHEFRRQQRVAAHVIDPGPAAPSRILIALREAESKKRNKHGPLLAAAQEHLTAQEAYGKRWERDPAPRDGATMKYRTAKFEADCGMRLRLRSHVASGRCRPLWDGQRRKAGGAVGRTKWRARSVKCSFERFSVYLVFK
jgi:hypothetical protein